MKKFNSFKEVGILTLIKSLFGDLFEIISNAVLTGWVISSYYYYFIKPIVPSLPDFNNNQAMGLGLISIIFLPLQKMSKKDLKKTGLKINSFSFDVFYKLILLLYAYIFHLIICCIQSI